ncbi:MAG: dihydrofolate reductase family protein [Bacteroidota bacterium]
MRKVILYIAMSLDGYIAKNNNDMSFLSIVQKDGEDYGYNDFIKEIDTVIMGRKTYDWVMTQVKEFPHVDIDSYIFTRTPAPSKGKISFYTGNLKELILELKQNEGKNIFIDGGAEIVNLLMQDNLIDEYIISIIPILLGDGLRLFKGSIMEQNLELIRSKQYKTGLIQLHYKR